jgi:hypothetical protein
MLFKRETKYYYIKKGITIKLFFIEFLILVLTIGLAYLIYFFA